MVKLLIYQASKSAFLLRRCASAVQVASGANDEGRVTERGEVDQRRV